MQTVAVAGSSAGELISATLLAVAGRRLVPRRRRHLRRRHLLAGRVLGRSRGAHSCAWATTLWRHPLEH